MPTRCSCYDLTQHAKHANVDLSVSEELETPIEVGHHPRKIRRLPLGCHCNSGVHSQHRRSGTIDLGLRLRAGAVSVSSVDSREWLYLAQVTTFNLSKKCKVRTS